ncbi:hypothetical protein N7519_000228 [Penicillium mononematosum]|uniref:uncharacterized protein n=1 Tax=Penicillium mononematosum TaxID=268346 RepID=UPI002549945F|nr:uncharacterized protein N7519_000228 [Penicillium mononematosum]KAJ6190207.1 hypothetical protein N7519_000228 [Penicillium mononematosum]
MEPTTSDHEPKTTKWDEGQIYVKACHNATRKLLVCLLSCSNEKKLNLTTAGLDLSSGGSPDYGPRFVEPFSHDKMREYVEREQPWDERDIHSLNILDIPKLYKYRRWNNAVHVIGVLHGTLNNFWGYDAPYRIADEDNELGSVYPMQGQWYLEGWTTAKDTSQPHINAFVADSQPHRVGRLNSGEVSLAYGLIAKRRLQEGYNDHRYIPITMFSVSDFTVRILQIWHDKQNPKALQIRSSRIMDFKDGVQNNLDDWVTILCWMTGEPVGDTKNGTEVVKVIEQEE